MTPDIWNDPYGWLGQDMWPYWPKGPEDGAINSDGSRNGRIIKSQLSLPFDSDYLSQGGQNE